jgi:hypothetical protein
MPEDQATDTALKAKPMNAAPRVLSNAICEGIVEEGPESGSTPPHVGSQLS